MHDLFVDRREELAALSRELSRKGFAFAVLYGRRRVGKTRLVLEAVREKKHLYYLAVEKNNLQYFSALVREKFPDAGKLREDWEVMLDFLKDEAGVLVIDEFQNLVKEDTAILSLFQRAIDVNLGKSGLKLVVLGSSVSLMSSQVLDYKSPLFGRKTFSRKIEALPFTALKQFFPSATGAQLVEIYGFAGGNPYYLEKVRLPFWQWLDGELKHPSFLKDEINFLMKYEFEELGTYKTILEAIANGRNSTGEIKDYARLQRTDVTPYLSNLIETDFVQREVPVTERPIAKKGRYSLKDEFAAFWFRFVQPHLSSIEERAYGAESVKAAYPEYLGRVFEKICRQSLVRLAGPFDKIGKWWHKDGEIDLMALREKEGLALLGECKWKDGVNAEKTAAKLCEKTALVEWRKGARKEELAVFAKSFSKKTSEFEGRAVKCFDLKEIVGA